MRTTAVVIGAGQSGLATSWWLAARAIDHVVLERGEVANTWRTERWPSLTLLTPNWQSRLPGFGYDGGDPDGFRSLGEAVEFLERYARRVSPPLRTHCPVTAVRRAADGYEVVTPQGAWRCRAVVLATGAFNVAQVPKLAHAAPPDLAQLTPVEYRGPAGLEPGGVLVVGAAATGAQIADELQRSGRQVTLAVGEHVRGLRTYRGRDIQWWMDAVGFNDERYDEVENLARARSLPSFQLAGYRDRRDIDLNALDALGLDFRRRGIRTIVWATGFRPDYSWLELPVLDRKGAIRHDGGVVTESPGLYVLGLPFLRRRKSSLIDGAGDDARDLSAHLAAQLGMASAAAASAGA